MSIKSLLNAIIADMRQRLSQRTTYSDDKTEEGEIINSIRVPGDIYDFGCSPVSGSKVVKGLEHGGYFPTNDNEH